MGCFNSTNLRIELKSENPGQDDDDIDHQISIRMDQEKTLGQAEKKFLLLGTGSSGKSTIMKQLLNIYPSLGNTEKIHPKIFQQNCYIAITKLLEQAQKLYNSDSVNHSDCFINTNNTEIVNACKYIIDYEYRHCWEEKTSKSVDKVEEQKEYEDSLTDLSKNIKYLWSLDCMKATWNKRMYFSIFENMDYFFDKIETIMDCKYQPSIEDQLRVRIRTAGMNERTIIVKEKKFTIVDVGGQQSERNKWVQFFADITALMYVVGLNQYCRVLFEDETQNAMIDSLRTFDQSINYKIFRKTEAIIFLNKHDLFKECIKAEIPLSFCFGKNWSEWEHAVDYHPIKDNKEEDDKLFELAISRAQKFIVEAYQSVVKNGRKLYFHLCTATNKANIEKVFKDVQNMLVSANLKKEGLVTFQ